MVTVGADEKTSAAEGGQREKWLAPRCNRTGTTYEPAHERAGAGAFWSTSAGASGLATLQREKAQKERKRVANPGLFDPQMANRQLFGLKMQASVASFSTSTHLTVFLSVASI